MSWKSELARKRITADGAAALVRSGDWVDYGNAVLQPDLFDAALARRTSELRQVKIRSTLSLRPRAVVEQDPEAESFLWFSWHFSGIDRRYHDAGRCNYLPMNFGEAPDYYRRFLPPVDVACIKTAPIDAQGFFNFGAGCSYIQAMLERARTVIVEPTEAMPYVLGSQESVHISQIDHILAGNELPLPELAASAPTEVERAVARRIAAEISDGACLQIGIGAMPNTVCSLLNESEVRDLGIHSEMFVDGFIDLWEAGKVTGARKARDPYQIIFTFAAGTRRQYDFLDRNPRAVCRPVDYTNLPHLIRDNDQVVSINNIAQLDLQGQAAAESVGHRHVSGTGGQLQFVRGAYASRGGKSFLCLASTYDKHGQRCSRIVPALPSGAVVTTPRTDVMYVVTEFGVANLKGKSNAERAVALIELAHPDFRDELARSARDCGLVPKGFA
ncbi:MAG TPA: acetyl-CoA hydrolase/transferase C-terminal domain-containing protein [Terriglobales bacterium]|nr:acetyl-CoA hydrolase/transferase C-terminal domain-containing protein [Terriglobales bacterium]